MSNMKPAHQTEPDVVLNKILSNREGLPDEEAASRLVKHGPNELIDKEAKSFLLIGIVISRKSNTSGDFTITHHIF